MKVDPKELCLLEAEQACKNHGNTSTQSQSTDTVAPHLAPKDWAALDLVWDPVDDMEDLLLVWMLGAHLPQVLGTQVLDANHVQGAQLNQALVHQLWATMKAGLQV